MWQICGKLTAKYCETAVKIPQNASPETSYTAGGRTLNE